MAQAPSGVLAGAAVSALALAGIVADLASAASVPVATARAAQQACRRVLRVDAPRVRNRAEIGAIGESLAATVRDVARASAPADIAGLLYTAAARAAVAVPVSASPVLTRQYTFAGALAASIQAACLGEAYLAEARSDFADRRAASAARARIAQSFEAAGDAVADRLGQEMLALLAEVVRECSGHLVRRATSLQPVVRVQAARSFPSTALAWSLYADPARADELVTRNACGTPLFMPASIEAVAPGAS